MALRAARSCKTVHPTNAAELCLFFRASMWMCNATAELHKQIAPFKGCIGTVVHSSCGESKEKPCQKVRQSDMGDTIGLQVHSNRSINHCVVRSSNPNLILSKTLSYILMPVINSDRELSLSAIQNGYSNQNWNKYTSQ